MAAVYAGLGMLFPFEWLDHNFMKNALLAVLLVTPLFGLLSTMVVSSRMAFFSDSLGHGAFTGIAVGAILGIVSPLISLGAFSVLFALLITYIKNRSSASTDTVIGVFSSTAIAAGLMILSRGGGFTKFSSYLIGDILSVSPEDLAALTVVFLAVLLLWGLLFNPLLLLSINRPFATSRGVSAFFVESAFAALLAVVVAVSIQWVGLLLINSLLVLPAATARNMAASVKAYHAASIGTSLASGVIGLVLAYYFNVAAGAAIVAVAASFFFITLGLRNH